LGKETHRSSQIGTRNWTIIILLGLAGQIAWNVENSWFNTFVFDTITPDPGPIAWMVALSAITATVTTLFMGTFSDRKGRRKPFIFYGYILWGVMTMIFPTTGFIQVTSVAIVLVILADMWMTFFGSTAYDAAFNAWTTDISNASNRGTLSAVLSILPLLAAIIGSALSGVLIDAFGYYTFFYTLGIVVILMGIVGGVLLREDPRLRQKTPDEQGRFWSQLFSVFRPAAIKQNKSLFIVFAALALYSIGVQVFMPYQMIYLNHYLHIDKSTAGILTAIPLLIAMLIAIPIGKLSDKGHGAKLAFIAPFLSFGGLLLFSWVENATLVVLTATLLFIGFVMFLLTTSAWMKNLMPEEQRGQFEGVRMIFNVLIPMVIGPAIGSYMISTYGISTVLDGKDGFIPTPVLFQVAAAVCLTATIPIVILTKNKTKTATMAEQEGAHHEQP